MNVVKHMEAAFLFSLGVVAAVGAATGGMSSAHAAVPVIRMVASHTAMQADIPVVKVSAKRLSAAEKQQSLAQERRGSRA